MHISKSSARLLGKEEAATLTAVDRGGLELSPVFSLASAPRGRYRTVPE